MVTQQLATCHCGTHTHELDASRQNINRCSLLAAGSITEGGPVFGTIAAWRYGFPVAAEVEESFVSLKDWFPSSRTERSS